MIRDFLILFQVQNILAKTRWWFAYITSYNWRHRVILHYKLHLHKRVITMCFRYRHVPILDQRLLNKSSYTFHRSFERSRLNKVFVVSIYACLIGMQRFLMAIPA